MGNQLACGHTSGQWWLSWLLIEVGRPSWMWVAWALDWIRGPEASWDLSKPGSRKAGVYSFSALDCGWEHNTAAWVPALTSPKWQSVMWDCKPIPAPRLLLIRVFYCSREDETKAVGFGDGICYRLSMKAKRLWWCTWLSHHRQTL